MKRLLLDVQQYSASVVYRKGNDIPIPDLLSRDVTNKPELDEENNLEFQIVLSMTGDWKTSIVEESKKCPMIKVLMEVIMKGWPDNIKNVDQRIVGFWTFRNELVCYEGLVFKGEKVFIPQ